MKAYLLAYSQAYAPQQMQHLLNDTEAVVTWVAPFPYAAILVSSLNVNDLAAVLRNRLPPGVWFMVTELRGESVQGWLPKDLWEYVNNPSQAWSRQLIAGWGRSSLGQPPPAPPPSTGGLFGPLRDAGK
ncbi:MAG: hypothetical protein OXC31_28315 [Spirochaetaceae bacterium]|nr:hypothetical protein [Spirochaetaceae bacterium]